MSQNWWAFCLSKETGHNLVNEKRWGFNFSRIAGSTSWSWGVHVVPRLSHSLLFFQTQAYHNVAVTPPAEKTVPGMAMLLGAVGIGMCGYSSKQLALYHRPSSRVLQWIGTHTDASAVAHRIPVQDATRRAGACQGIPPPSFVGDKVPSN